MSNILRLEKRLNFAPSPVSVPDVTIRPFAGPADVAAWLALRTECFAGMIAAGRAWTPDDFTREFQTKPWWSPERMWFAQLSEASRERKRPVSPTDAASQIIATITLGRTGREPHDEASVQWLMVAPNHRRRGIATALLNELERAAFEQGERKLTLETHAAWLAAVEFYRRHGYL